jgi:Fe-S-cluster containining protein
VSSPCESCHAGCCRSFAVPVTGADILRIEESLGLSFWDFVCRWEDREGRIARNHAPHFHFSDEPATPFVICLIHEASRFFPDTLRCRFLVEGEPDDVRPLGQARCGIYDQRPSACRAFPAKLNESSDLAIIYDVPERGRDVGHPAYGLCPRQWEARDLDPVRTVQDLVVARYEMAFFAQLARLWNRTPQAWTVFPEFLRSVYGSRLQRETKVEEQPDILPMPGVATDKGQSARAA